MPDQKGSPALSSSSLEPALGVMGPPCRWQGKGPLVGSAVRSGARRCLRAWQGTRSEQTGAGGRAGMIPALIISVPPYTNAAAHSLRRSAAKCCARWMEAQATSSAQKLPVQHSQPTVALLAESGSPPCPHASGEGDERHQLWVLWDGTHGAALAPPASSCTDIPTAPRCRDGKTTPGRPAAKGLKCLVIPFVPGLHLFAD